MNDSGALKSMLDAARAEAYSGGMPVRRKDAALYGLLAKCLAACEIVQREGREDDLRELIRVSVDARNPSIWGQGRAAGNQGRGRRYAEAASDVFVLVCRYVLPETETRAARSRYASALREASRRQIASGQLAAWLSENGGVLTLFKSRPVEAKTVATRTLHLNSSITCPKHGRFSVVLEMDARGFFNVVETTS
jgi:hypothetical protein